MTRSASLALVRTQEVLVPVAPRSSGLRVALVGTRGVPARYGGFETCVEEVGARLAGQGADVEVHCRTEPGGPGRDARPRSHLGMRLVHLPAVRHRALETLSHTGLSALRLLVRRPDAAIVFNAANAIWLPVLRLGRIPVATHVDGLEWQRSKWGRGGRAYYRWAERLAVRWSDAIIADAPGIAAHHADRHGARSVLIAYGAPVVEGAASRVGELGLEPDGYHLVVARFEPENNVHIAVEGYVRSSCRLPLVVVGTAPYNDEYIARVRAAADDRVRLVGAVWDQELLDHLYLGARTYVHGHSVGGTNPSLLRAIGAGAPTLAYDVVFNRDVLGDDGRYFLTADDVARVLEEQEAEPDVSGRRAALRARARAYDWDDVAAGYEQLVRALVAGTAPRPRPRRTRGPGWSRPARRRAGQTGEGRA